MKSKLPSSRPTDRLGRPESDLPAGSEFQRIPGMQLSDVSNLVKLLDKSGLAEMRFSDGTFSLVLKKESKQVVAAAPTYVAAPAPIGVAHAGPAPAAAPAAPAAPAEKSAASGYKEITSPMVGTFYSSSSPGAPALAQVGTVVKPGQVLCIIEAMKIMNEIESDLSGEIVEVCVTNETPVEYGTVLYRVRPV
jgi:acetyl-CoA carboxylase biotin carboxyl carrier protein